MKEELIKRLKDLGLKNAQIERDLELPQNSLSAVLNGHKPMPDKWVEGVQRYLDAKAPQEPAKPIKDIFRPWIEEIESYCLSKGFDPEYLIEFHKTHCNSATTKAIEMIRKEFGPVSSDNRRVLNASDPKTRQMREPEEGTNAHFMRYGVYYKSEKKPEP